MLNSFIIVFREGFESFLLVAVILSYLRKSGQRSLTSVVYIAIILALSASAGLGYVLRQGLDESVAEGIFGSTMGGYVSHFLANESLREGILGVVAIVMVGSLVVHVRHGPEVQQRMVRLDTVSSRSSRIAARAMLPSRSDDHSGTETAIMLLQVHGSEMVWSVSDLAGGGSGANKFGHLINGGGSRSPGYSCCSSWFRSAFILSTSFQKPGYCLTARCCMPRRKSFPLMVCMENGFQC